MYHMLTYYHENIFYSWKKKQHLNLVHNNIKVCNNCKENLNDLKFKIDISQLNCFINLLAMLVKIIHTSLKKKLMLTTNKPCDSCKYHLSSVVAVTGHYEAAYIYCFANRVN